MNRRLVAVERRVTLGHELGHVYWGHDCTTLGAENQANDYAARVLILPHEYASAERVSIDIEHLADELDVTPEVVHHYQRFVLQRFGDRTYARMPHLENTGPRRIA